MKNTNPRTILVPALEIIIKSKPEELSINIYVIGDYPNIYYITKGQTGKLLVLEEADPDQAPIVFKTVKSFMNFLKKDFISIISMSSNIKTRNKPKVITLFSCDPESGESCYETQRTQKNKSIIQNKSAGVIQRKYLDNYYRPGGPGYKKAKSEFEQNKKDYY
jgi:hypothetical protein